MKDGSREQFSKLSDVVVRNVVMKMLAVLCPRSSPEFFQDACRDGRDAILLVPVDKGLLEILPNLPFGREDFVLEGSCGN